MEIFEIVIELIAEFIEIIADIFTGRNRRR